jgi:hypothetical protein
MTKLLQIQPDYKKTAVAQYVDQERKQGWEHLRFKGTTIGSGLKERSPQQWYLWVNRQRAIPDFDKRKLNAVIYCAFWLRATRDAIRMHMVDKQRLVHGTAVGMMYGKFILFRALLEELASRLPRNLSFNESRFGKYLLQITGGKLTKESIPYYLDPIDVKPKQTITFEQLLHLTAKRSFFRRAANPDKEKVEAWAAQAPAESLIYTILSAKSLFPKMWERSLRARDITPNELQGLVKKEQARARKNLL